MVRIVLLLSLILNFSPIFAQNDAHKKAADKFLIEFNEDRFDEIYGSLSPKMQKNTTKNQFITFLKTVKKDIGKLHSLKLYDYSENKRKSRGSYDGNFEFETASVRITVDEKGLIMGLSIKKTPVL